MQRRNVDGRFCNATLLLYLTKCICYKLFQEKRYTSLFSKNVVIRASTSMIFLQLMHLRKLSQTINDSGQRPACQRIAVNGDSINENKSIQHKNKYTVEDKTKAL